MKTSDRFIKMVEGAERSGHMTSEDRKWAVAELSRLLKKGD